MALIELCLLSLLSPQTAGAAPAPPAPAVAEAPPQAAGAAPAPSAPTAAEAPPQPVVQSEVEADPDAAVLQDPRRELALLERGEQPTAPDRLLALTTCDDEAVAARAAWLLAQQDSELARQHLLQVIDGPVPDARLHAVRALCAGEPTQAFTIALHELQDEDRRVRTLAAQTLGALRRPAATEPLVGMIEEVCGLPSNEPATDVQAALLALADIGSEQGLLRVATAIDDGQVPGAGNLLAFTLQTLSPKLGDGELTVLCAVLAHREPPARRYAITRLAELGDQRAISALEGRLGKEEQQLRPLVELALNQLRRDTKPAPNDDLDRALANAEVLWTRTKNWWRGLNVQQRAIVAGVPAVLLVLLVLWRRAAARRARTAAAVAAAAWVQPSDEFLDAEAAIDEDGEEQYAAQQPYGFGQDDYADEPVEQDADDDPQFDTSGWQEDGEQGQPTGREVEDELFR